MGVSASTQTRSPSSKRPIKSSQHEIRSGPSDSIVEKIRRLSSGVKVVNASDGRLQEYRTPVKAKEVTSKNKGRCFLGSSENMSIGECVPRVPDDEDLSPAQIYFLLPESKAQMPISLADLCSLAITASSVIGNNSDVYISSSNRKLTGLRSTLKASLSM